MELSIYVTGDSIESKVSRLSLGRAVAKVGRLSGFDINVTSEDSSFDISTTYTTAGLMTTYQPQNDTEREEVNYIVGFAEEELPKLKLDKPTFFSTMCVLAHLPDDLTLDILNSMDKIAPVGSLWSASEPWGDTYARECWYVRTPEWWSDNLPDWEFEFYSDYDLTDPPGRHKGFTAIKS